VLHDADGPIQMVISVVDADPVGQVLLRAQPYRVVGEGRLAALGIDEAGQLVKLIVEVGRRAGWCGQAGSVARRASVFL
jgi:hypothetical protein